MLTMQQWTNNQGNINVFAPLEWTVKNWQSLAAKGQPCKPGDLLKDAATSLEWSGIDATALKDLHARWENAPFEWGYADSKLVDPETIKAFTDELTELAETIKAENPGACWTVRNAAKHEADNEPVKAFENKYICDGFTLVCQERPDHELLTGTATEEDILSFAKVQLKFISTTGSTTLDHDQASQVFADWGTARWWLALRIFAKTALADMQRVAEEIAEFAGLVQDGRMRQEGFAEIVQDLAKVVADCEAAYQLAMWELAEID